MLFLYSYPPVPLSTWKGGTHIYGLSSYEGAAATVEDGRNKISRKLRREFSCYFVCARSAPAAPEVVRCRTAENKEFASLILSKSPLPGPPLKGRGSLSSNFDCRPTVVESRSLSCLFRIPLTSDNLPSNLYLLPSNFHLLTSDHLISVFFPCPSLQFPRLAV